VDTAYFIDFESSIISYGEEEGGIKSSRSSSKRRIKQFSDTTFKSLLISPMTTRFGEKIGRFDRKTLRK
jgi:hypothetical protein